MHTRSKTNIIFCLFCNIVIGVVEVVGVCSIMKYSNYFFINGCFRLLVSSYLMLSSKEGFVSLS